MWDFAPYERCMSLRFRHTTCRLPETYRIVNLCSGSKIVQNAGPIWERAKPSQPAGVEGEHPVEKSSFKARTLDTRILTRPVSTVIGQLKQSLEQILIAASDNQHLRKFQSVPLWHQIVHFKISLMHILGKRIQCQQEPILPAGL